MITLYEYLTQHAKIVDVPLSVADNAERLLSNVNALLADFKCPSPNAGLRSGYRPPAYNAALVAAHATGAPGAPRAAAKSKHMTGDAVDLNDNDEALDNWISKHDDGSKNSLLVRFGLYREAPAATKSWCHLQSIAPKSGRRTFNPF